ncbi:hypothetical protein BDZ91DRAFT_714261 [Kalaharituber pfeilii]|nr:hypothetical protein BDZ91DRAFT_714261 [Kalaharituber pfeilii]
MCREQPLQVRQPRQRESEEQGPRVPRVRRVRLAPQLRQARQPRVILVATELIPIIIYSSAFKIDGKLRKEKGVFIFFDQ